MKWRISDARQFIRNNGVEQRNLENRLGAVAQAAFNEEVTKHTVRGVLSDERAQIMQNVKARLEAESKPFGIEIRDVRIKRVDLVPEVTASVFKRMIAERTQVANQLRSEGEATKEQIRAQADKQVSVIVAEATLEAQKTKGEADAQATQIYGEAFGRDPKFAQFYRNLEAYRASFHGKSDVMVVDTGSDFFKAMRGSGGAGSPTRPRPPPPRRSSSGPAARQRDRAGADPRRPAAVPQPGRVASHVRARAAAERRPDPDAGAVQPRDRRRRPAVFRALTPAAAKAGLWISPLLAAASVAACAKQSFARPDTSVQSRF